MPEIDRATVDREARRAERALVVFLTLVGLLLAVYALGVSGIPGDAFGAALDWAISRGVVDASAPVVQAATTVL